MREVYKKCILLDMERSAKDLLARNLRHYREVNGLTQAEAAAAAGVTRAAYLRAETGKSMPGDDVLAALCKRYRVKMADFFQSMEVPQCAFLAKACKSKEQKARRLETIRRVCRLARDRRMLREIGGRDVKADGATLEQVRVRVRRDVEAGASMGRAVRNCLWPSGLYTPESLPIAIDRAGIVLCMMPFVERGVDGFSFHDEEIGWVIAVNASGDASFETRSMALAHELGHVLQETADGDHGSKGRHDKAEESAVRFARELLIPKGAFVSRWNEYLGKSLWERVLAIKREFKVAASTVLHQAIEFGLEMEDAYRVFAIQAKEHGCSASPDPCPCNANMEDVIYDSLAMRACLDDEITMSRCAEILGRPLLEVRKLLRERVA